MISSGTFQVAYSAEFSEQQSYYSQSQSVSHQEMVRVAQAQKNISSVSRISPSSLSFNISVLDMFSISFLLYPIVCFQSRMFFSHWDLYAGIWNVKIVHWHWLLFVEMQDTINK